MIIQNYQYKNDQLQETLTVQVWEVSNLCTNYYIQVPINDPLRNDDSRYIVST